MRKASIITMHFPCNYGAVLQTYALSHYLQSCGLDVNVINYIPEYFKENISLWYVGNKKYKKNPLLRLLYYAVVVPQKMRRAKVFSAFRCSELNITERFSQEELMNGNKAISDFYFCGSDQIWNENNETLFDPIYFLQFVKGNGKAFSYAASGTISYPFSDVVQSVLLPWLEKFDRISVREDLMKQNLQKALNREVKWVCDPVFLIDKIEWLRLASKGSLKGLNKSYILVYAIGNDNTPYRKARELGNELHCSVYGISWFRCPYVDKTLKCTPYDFLSIIANAKCVITNSFHGTAFSIIFNRQFWVCKTSIANHRLLSILNVTNLQNRLIEDEIFNMGDIDWSKVSQLIYKHINDSKDYISRCIDL